MYILKKQENPKIKSLSTYMEIYNSLQTAYRVTVGIAVSDNGTEMTIYGIEIENFKNGKKTSIHDFSDKLKVTVAFAETLIKNKNTPEQLYNLALNYLGTSIHSDNLL